MGINIDREKIILKGYANKTDIRKFLKIGNEKANEIFKILEEDTINDGKRVMDSGIKIERLLKYSGMTRKEIEYNSQKERELGL